MVGGSPDLARTRRSDAVASHIRDAILTGRLREGEFVRPEAVAEEVGVSATPAREGLMLLHAEGLLVHVPRRGFRVASLSLVDVEDAYAAQALLAGELAARATSLAVPGLVDRLTEIQDELEAVSDAGDADATERLNHQFHRELYGVVAAPKLKWLLGLTLQAVPRRYYGSIAGWPQATVRDHRSVLAALAAGDAPGVRTAMETHVRGAGRLLVTHLADTGGDQ